LINALDEAGVDVGLTHEGQVQQAGSWSRATGEEAWLLTVRGHGENPGGNAELLAEHSPTNPRREKMLRERLADIADAMTPFDLVPAESLNPAAKADLVDPVIREWRTDPLGTMESVKFLILLHSEIIDVRGQDDDELRAILEELRAVADYEMALWLTPRGS
jgi:hypothetical protein